MLLIVEGVNVDHHTSNKNITLDFVSDVMFLCGSLPAKGEFFSERANIP